MSNFFEHLSKKIEVDSTRSPFNRKSSESLRRINLVNYITIISILNMVGYSALFAILNYKIYKPAILFHSINVLISLVIITVNRKGYHKIAKILLATFLPLMMALVATVFFGRATEFHIFLLVSILIPPFIWSYRKKGYLIGFILYSLSLYLLIQFSPYLPNPIIKIPESHAQLFRDTNILICFLSATATILIYQHFYNSTEKKLVKQSKDLKQSQKERAKIYSIIAHDLRGPLYGIGGLTEVLASDNMVSSNAYLNELTSSLMGSVNSTNILLENLLAWSKNNRSDFFVEIENIDLKNSIEKTIQLFTFLLSSKKIKINTSVDESIKVNYSQNYLDTILRNLISNAIKYTPSGGIIDISANCFENKVKISISDTGVGMTKEVQKKIFNPNFNESFPGTNKEPGSGLGLKFCKEFIEKSGGKIWAESQPGVGSKFYFTIKKF